MDEITCGEQLEHDINEYDSGRGACRSCGAEIDIVEPATADLRATA